jgi:hypothetical protein
MIYLRCTASRKSKIELNLANDSKCLVINESSGKTMIKFMRPIITIGLGLVLAFFSAALGSPTQPAIQEHPSATALFVQTTPTPQPKDLSKIGSTDGITAMGFFIALIIIIPILMRRKFWMQIQ